MCVILLVFICVRALICNSMIRRYVLVMYSNLLQDNINGISLDRIGGIGSVFILSSLV